jgi:V/A-type H+-transporting ATPase subunit I
MIAPMKKAILVLRERGKSSALKTLRRLGVVHADPIEGRGESWETASGEKNRLDRALGVLLSYRSKEKTAAAADLSYPEALTLADRVLSTSDAIKRDQERVSSLRKEMERVQGWGDFDPEALAFFRGKGVDVRLYELLPKAAAALPESLPILKLSEGKAAVRLAAFPEKPADLPEGLEEFALPAASLSAMREEENSLLAAVGDAEASLAEAASRKPLWRSPAPARTPT